MSWITSTTHTPHRQDPLPVALATEHCTWSLSARRALETAGRAYRIAYCSSTLIGTHAPVVAGLAVTVGPSAWFPEGLRAMRPEEGLPRLPEFGILMLRGANARQPVTDALAEYIAATFRADTKQMAA